MLMNVEKALPRIALEEGKPVQHIAGREVV
jgi:hypothetical protein